MLTGLYAKLIGLGLILAALAGLFLWGHHVGAASVQARWDAAKAAQAAAVARQAAASATQTQSWTQQFAATAAQFEATTHEPTPAVADSVAAAAAAGTVQLRDRADRCPGQVSGAAARSRAADAAATAALAQRTADSIAAVRVGDAADARERQLGEQVKALQALLRAERVPQP
jgi:hypothetical protein